MKGLGRKLLLVITLALAVPPSAAPAAEGYGVEHELAVELDPASHQLRGRDRMVVTQPPQRLALRLAARARVEEVTVAGRKARWHRTAEGLEIALPPPQANRLTVTLAYSARFNDAAPAQPINTDNPGYGVRGTITAAGTVLLAGSGWYPQVLGAARTIQLAVTAPAGTLAVTSGRLEGHTTNGGKTVSRWRIDRPTGAVSLCAGKYTLGRKQAGGHTLLTYFSAQRQHLSEAYLDAGLAYLAAYSRRFGPYPFESFAVVENFYPTGYGFAGWTLMGGRVLELPFIIPTSLRHEIAHCWWGNGVRVDATHGNWSEGLATYVADYAHRAEQGEAAAIDYRRQLLRNYTNLVNPREALPVTRFMARRDRVTKAIGYDKVALIFHMLHRRLGEGFWRALADLYRERRFTEASWTDLQFYFQRHTDQNLDRFFDQWLNRSDAPRLRLEGVVYDAASGRLSGQVVQEAPYYDLSVDLRITAAGQQHHRQLTLEGARSPFSLSLTTPPQRVEADPEAHLFRRLWPVEIPATINSLKAAGQVSVVTPPDAGREAKELASLLPRALGLEQRPANAVPAGAVIWVAPPAPENLPPGVEIEGGRLRLRQVSIPSEADTIFLVWRDSGSGAIRALYWSPTLNEARRVATKIPHYGRYSYLAFEAANNNLKDTWPVTDSPLRVDWPASEGGSP